MSMTVEEQLWKAVDEGKLNEVITILNTNKGRIDLNWKHPSKAGSTALIYAAHSSRLEVCKELIQNGADLNLKNNDGQTALMCATRENQIDICKELIKSGVDLNIKSNSGKTALMIAQQISQTEIAELLSNESQIEQLRNEGEREKQIREGRPDKSKQISKLQKQNDVHKNEILILKQEINERNEELKNVKNELNDLKNKKCENINWLIETAKSKHQQNDQKINLVSNNNEIINSSTNTVNHSSNFLGSSLSFKTIINSFNEINEFGYLKNKQLLTNKLLQELNDNIYKSKIKVQIDFDESKSNLEYQKEIIQTKKNHLKNNYQKLNKLFDETINLQEETVLLEEEIEKSIINFKKTEIEFQKCKLIFDECEKVIQKINDINDKNSEFMKKWNQTISGNIDLLFDENDDKLIYCLLEYCNLDDWLNELKTQILSKLTIKICDIRPHHLMTLQKNNDVNTTDSTSTTKKKSNTSTTSTPNNNYRKMTFGEAKYFCIVIQEIQKNKELPKVMNDIDLNEKNMKYWTIQNVFDYFTNHKYMNEVAKVLFESKINGIVLLNLNEVEIQFLGINNIEELNSLVNLLKQFQKNEIVIVPTSIPIPEDLICLLTHKLMIDPVIAEDGNTYERKAIEEWFKNGNNVSPITKEEQIGTFLIPNNGVRKQSEKWRKENEI